MSEESHEKTDSTPTNSNFETFDPDAGSKLINEEVTQAAAIESKGEKLIQRFKDLLSGSTSKIEGGQMLAGSADVDRVLSDSLRRKLVLAGSK